MSANAVGQTLPALPAAPLPQAANQPSQMASAGALISPLSTPGLAGSRSRSRKWRGSTAQGICMYVTGMTGVLALILALTGFTIASVWKHGGAKNGGNPSVYCTATARSNSGGFGVQNCTNVPPQVIKFSSITCFGLLGNGFYCLGE